MRDFPINAQLKHVVRRDISILGSDNALWLSTVVLRGQQTHFLVRLLGVIYNAKD